MSEEVSGILDAIMMRGWKGDVPCRLVFTTTRLIVARKGMLETAKVGYAGGGALGGLIGGAIAGREEKKKLKEFKQLSPESILKSDKKNFDVPYSEITKAEVGKRWRASCLYIYSTKVVYKFGFEGIKLENVENSIRSLLPEKVTTERVDKLD
jgi:hypothetical protein